MILLVNKDNIFNENDINDFEMVEYENYCEKTLYVESETFKHFEMLRAHLKVDGVIIEIDDAYRSLESQENLFLKFMNKYGMEYALSVVAMPGTSEHHTGQAIDLVIQKDGKWITENEDLLKEVEIFEKIHKALKHFGFILRYPKDKEEITGYPYEPWHIRYVGEEFAMNIGNLTLEEYLEK
jgi:LAS superfamily LD-carboxypeptidase LdcB